MTINERFKRVRKALSLTQSELGKAIGLKQNSITQIEQGKNTVSDRTVILLCKSFHVDEDWLREGGDDDFMFSGDYEAGIVSLCNDYGLDDLSQVILTSYIKMHHKKRHGINLFLRELSLEVMREDIGEVRSGIYEMIDNIATLQRDKSERTKLDLSSKTTTLFSELLTSRYTEGGGFMADADESARLKLIEAEKELAMLREKEDLEKIDKEAESYRQEMLEEKKATEKSSALDGIKEAK